MEVCDFGVLLGVVCTFGVLLGVVCTFGSVVSAVVLVSLLLLFCCRHLLCSGPAAHQVRLLCGVSLAGLGTAWAVCASPSLPQLTFTLCTTSQLPTSFVVSCKLEQSKNMGSKMCMTSNARHEATLCMNANECHICLYCADCSQPVSRERHMQYLMPKAHDAGNPTFPAAEHILLHVPSSFWSLPPGADYHDYHMQGHHCWSGEPSCHPVSQWSCA